MAILTIGRVGLDVELPKPAEWSETAGFDRGREIVLRGYLRGGATLAETSALRTELLEQQGKLIAVTYTGDDLLNGFYVLTDSRIDSRLTSYRGSGLYLFEVNLFRIGSESRTELQSLMTQVEVTNSHSIAPEYWHATPPDALAYNAGPGTTPTEHSRTALDGEMAVYLDVPTTADPTWSIDPLNYYEGAVNLYTNGRLRAGQDFKNDPADWEINNGLIRVRPQTFGGTSNGLLDFSWWSTSWGTDVTFEIRWEDTTAIPKWHYVTALRNDPELVQLRIVRDAETAPPSAHRHELDITVRRGAPYAACYYKYTGADSTHSVYRNTVDAATAAAGYIKDAGTISGHKWVLGTPQAHTQDTTNGGIVPTVSSKFFKFYVGAAIDNAANASGDGPNDIRDQYTAWGSETVRAVRR